MKNVSLRYAGPGASAKKVFIKLLSLYKKYHYKNMSVCYRYLAKSYTGQVTFYKVPEKTLPRLSGQVVCTQRNVWRRTIYNTWMNV